MAATSSVARSLDGFTRTTGAIGVRNVNAVAAVGVTEFIAAGVVSVPELLLEPPPPPFRTPPRNPQIKAKNPSYGVTDIAKELGAAWKLLGEKEKSKYEVRPHRALEAAHRRRGRAAQWAAR